MAMVKGLFCFLSLPWPQIRQKVPSFLYVSSSHANEPHSWYLFLSLSLPKSVAKLPEGTEHAVCGGTPSDTRTFQTHQEVPCPAS